MVRQTIALRFQIIPKPTFLDLIKWNRYWFRGLFGPNTGLHNSAEPSGWYISSWIYFWSFTYLRLFISLPPAYIRYLPRKWYKRSIRCWWTARTPATAPASPCSWMETCWTTLLSSSPLRACRRARCSKWWKVRFRGFYSHLGLSCTHGAKRNIKAMCCSLLCT